LLVYYDLITGSADAAISGNLDLCARQFTRGVARARSFDFGGSDMTASARPNRANLIRLLCVGLPFVLAATATTAQNRQLEVPIHQATRVQLGAAAGSVIVANPAIADVAVTDARTLFITGKAYGVTEVIAVDGLGRPLFQRQIVVAPSSAGTVRVWRGRETTEVTCGATCAPAPAGRGS